MAAQKTSKEYAADILECKNRISDLNTEIEVKTKLLNGTTVIDATLKQLTTEEITTAQYAIKALQSELERLEYLYEAAKKLEEAQEKEDEDTDVEIPDVEDGEEIPLPPAEEGGTGGDIDCGCKDEEDGGGEDEAEEGRKEVPPDHLIPPLNMRGVFTYKPPFDKPEYKDLEVTVYALRIIKEVVDAEEDPWLNIYQAHGLQESDYQRDVKWKIPIVVFVTDLSKYFYVPATYLGSLPRELSGVKYQQVILGADLGFLPLDFNIDLIKDTIIEDIKAVAGIITQVDVIQASQEQIVTEEEHKKFTNLIAQRQTDTNSPSVKLKLLEERYDQIREQLKLMNHCFHHHLEKGLEKLDLEKKILMEYWPKQEIPEEDLIVRPDHEFRRTETEYQDLYAMYLNVQFGYNNFLARYKDLEERYFAYIAAAEKEQKRLNDIIDDKTQHIEEIELARDKEYRIRDRYYNEETHLFQKHVYISSTNGRNPAEMDEYKDLPPEEIPEEEKYWGAMMVSISKKKELDPKDPNDTLGYVLGEHMILCPDCIKHLYEIVDDINLAVLETIVNKKDGVDKTIDNTKRTKIVETVIKVGDPDWPMEVCETCGHESPAELEDGATEQVIKTSVPDPVYMELEDNWDFGVYSIDNGVKNETLSQYIQKGNKAEMGYIWFGTTKDVFRQYCQHIPKRFHNKQLVFYTGDDDYFNRLPIAGNVVGGVELNNAAREYGPFKLKLNNKEFVPNPEVKAQMVKIFDTIIASCNKHAATGGEVAKSKADDNNYVQYGVNTFSVSGCHQGFARSLVSSARLTEQDKLNIDNLMNATDYNLAYVKKTPREITWIDVCVFMHDRLNALMRDYCYDYATNPVKKPIYSTEETLANYSDLTKVWVSSHENAMGYTPIDYLRTFEYWHLANLMRVYRKIALHMYNKENNNPNGTIFNPNYDTFIKTDIEAAINDCW